MILHRGQRVSLRRIALLSCDTLAIAIAVSLSAILRLGWDHGYDFLARNAWSLLVSAGIFLVVFYAAGMYEREALTKRDASYVLPFVSTAIALMIVILMFYARFHFKVGRGILLLSGIFIFFFAWLSRYAYREIVRRGLLSKCALVIGEGREAAEAIRLVKSTPDAGLKIRGVITARPIPPGTMLAGVPVIGSIERIRELADAFEAETLIVAMSLAREPGILRALRPLRCSGTEIIDYVSLHESLAQEIPIDHINDEWLMSAAMNSSVIHIRKIKRILDFSVALIGLLVGAPIMLLTAVAIWLDSKGPILYRQRRAGLDGRIITVLKFRSMRVDAEAKTGAVWAGHSDSRVTRVGRFIRKWRLDEFPQLVNVLRGEMSLVGPRPERPEFVEMLSATIPFYRERLMVPPGITGWAQVKYPYAASVEAARRKLQYDLYYIKHMSFFLDVLILLRTFKTILIGLRHSEEVAPEPAPQTEIAVLPTAAAETHSAKMA